MRVLMISKAMVAGAYHGKLRELAVLGVDVHLVVPWVWGEQRLEVTKGVGYGVHPLKAVLSGFNHLHFYPELPRVFRELNPDIVHIDEEHYSLVTYQAMRLARDARAGALFFTWQNILKKYPFPFSYFERENFKLARMAIAGNEEAGGVLREKGFNKEIAIIPQFGVDTDMFFEQRVPELEEALGLKERFVIGFVGRVVEDKGVMLLIEALSKVSGDCMLLVIGDGRLKRKVLKRAEKLGMGGRVRIIGQVPSREVPCYLNCLDCLVLPSITRSNWKEQFGRVLVETMACNVPVVGSDSGEIPKVIGDSGLIFREGDSDDLKEKIETVRRDRGLREEIKKRARKRVLGNYTHRKIAGETFEVYRKILSEVRLCA